MNTDQNLIEDNGGRDALNTVIGEYTFGLQDIINRRKNAIANRNEAQRIGEDNAVLELNGYIDALDWVIRCINANQ
jgi:hypothetical protein